ncbi:hypothetical protein QFZ73_004553 [Peribacillus sp. V2I11]|nr:hypothetical protein [Peribacillus sp. V2I11]
MASVNGKRTERSIKELKDSSNQYTLGMEQTSLCSCLPAREPSKVGRLIILVQSNVLRWLGGGRVTHGLKGGAKRIWVPNTQGF